LDTLFRDVIAEVGGGGNPVAQIIFFERFLDADRDGFQVSPR